MKTLLVISIVLSSTLAVAIGTADDLSREGRKISRLKEKIRRQHEALEASQTALLYVVTRWSGHGGTTTQPEFFLSVAALRKIEEARP
jgi:hypothetical protein